MAHAPGGPLPQSLPPAARASFLRGPVQGPELATEVTLGPIEDFDFDAAILFSDLLFPLEALGMPLELRARPEARLARARAGKICSAWRCTSRAPRCWNSRRQPCERFASGCRASKGLLGFVGGPLTLFFYAAAGSHQGDLGIAHAGLADGRYAGFLREAAPAAGRRTCSSNGGPEPTASPCSTPALASSARRPSIAGWSRSCAPWWRN